MKLFIFDIDGTLTDTNDLDAECYFNSIEKVLKEKLPFSLRQQSFETDTGCMMEIWERYKGRLPRTYEFNSVKVEFISQFHSSMADGKTIREINGAKALFESLKNTEGMCVALATGAWKESAILKLDAADIRWRFVPLVSSDKYLSKYEILKECRDHCKVFYSTMNFDKEVYVGDKDWDEMAAKKLGMDFLKIGRSTEEDVRILESYPSLHDFVSLFE